MKMNNNLFIDKFNLKLLSGLTPSPYLFLSNNLELLNQNLEILSKELLSKFDIPDTNLFIFRDNWEKIKISNIKEFFKQSNIKTPYKFQIFLIENTSRMTLQSANSCLKLFEEPWDWNIIFMTNKSESWILDTILSRVQIENVVNSFKPFTITTNIKNEFFINLIDSYILNKKLDLISYFFSSKLEKTEYISFLNTLLNYWKSKFLFIDFLEELSQDICSVEQNNVNIRYIVDKYILKITKIYEKN